MKNKAVKVITISSQIMVVVIFLFSLIIKEENNSKILSIQNDTESKMAQETLMLFKEEERLLNGETEESTNNNLFLDNPVLNTYTGILTGYGPDCVGCGNYKTKKVSTSTGYHIANIVEDRIEPAFTITYDDNEYGNVRIVAADSNIPFYSIVRITIPGSDPILAVVLDRGSTVGFENCRSPRGCLTNFDLLYPTEKESLGKTRGVKFEMLRYGK